MPGHNARFAVVTFVAMTALAPVAAAMPQGPQAEPHQLRAFAPGSKQLALSGSIFADNDNDGTESSSYTSFGAGGRYTRFVKRGVGIGVSLNFNNYSADFSGSSDGTYDGSSWSIGPVFEYYFNVDRLVTSSRGAVFPFLATSYQLSHGNNNFATNSGGIDFLSRSTSNGTAYSAEVGVLYMLGDWAGLTLSGRYSSTTNRSRSNNSSSGGPATTTTSKSSSDNTQLALGTRWFLF